jgi:hypothetical protein
MRMRGLGCGQWRGILRSCSGGGGTIGQGDDESGLSFYNGRINRKVSPIL